MAVVTIPVITDNGHVVSWTSGAVIDGDGCPRCYAPPRSGLPALDYLANAGNESDGWYGLVCIGGEPVIQQGGPCKGYYLSPTALCDRSKTIIDPARYVDSSAVPYISIPPELKQHGVALGDLAWVTYCGRATGAVVADIGPRNHYGEISIYCAQLLGIPSGPKNGGVSSGVAYTLFKRSAASPAWPVAVVDIQRQASLLYAQTQPQAVA